MIIKCYEDHFRWIGIMADRIICSKNREYEIPLLSLSFLEGCNILDIFSKFSRPIFPITIENLSNAKLYGIIVSAITFNNKTALSDFEYLYNFDLILDYLSKEGYIPQNPCDSSGLKNGILEHHINLCKSIEFYVVDKSINTTLLISDLYHLPHSFFVLNSDRPIIHLQDAISLWLSKFHCNSYFSDEVENDNTNSSNKNSMIQLDASKYSKIAACLARIFPEKIDKDEIQNGETQEEIRYNVNLSKLVLDPIHAFVIEKFPTDENLFFLFISDLFYATRSGAEKFYMIDHPSCKPHLPTGNRYLRSPRMKRTFTRDKENSCLDFLNAVLSSQHRRKNSPKITKPNTDSKSSTTSIQKTFNGIDSRNSSCVDINVQRSIQFDDDIVIVELKNDRSCDIGSIDGQRSVLFDSELINIDSRNASSSDIDFINKQRSYDSNQDACKYYSLEDIKSFNEEEEYDGEKANSNENKASDNENEQFESYYMDNDMNKSNQNDLFGNKNHVNKYGSFCFGNFTNKFNNNVYECRNRSNSISNAPSNFDYLYKENEAKSKKNEITIDQIFSELKSNENSFGNEESNLNASKNSNIERLFNISEDGNNNDRNVINNDRDERNYAINETYNIDESNKSEMNNNNDSNILNKDSNERNDVINETEDINENNNNNDNETSVSIENNDGDINTNISNTLHEQNNEYSSRENNVDLDTLDGDDEMTNEMILREIEKYEFHLKLKHLSTNSQSLTTNESSDTITIPNYETIVNALRFTSLSNPKYKRLLDEII